MKDRKKFNLAINLCKIDNNLIVPIPKSIFVDEENKQIILKDNNKNTVKIFFYRSYKELRNFLIENNIFRLINAECYSKQSDIFDGVLVEI